MAWNKQLLFTYNFVTYLVTLFRYGVVNLWVIMNVFVKDRKLRGALEDERLCKRRYGVDMSMKLRMRVATLRATESLADFWPPMSGPERCHELKGKLAGTFSIDLKQPYRLLFKPTTADPEQSSNEQERWRSIKSIEILRIEDTHG